MSHGPSTRYSLLATLNSLIAPRRLYLRGEPLDLPRLRGAVDGLARAIQGTDGTPVLRDERRGSPIDARDLPLLFVAAPTLAQ